MKVKNLVLIITTSIVLFLSSMEISAHHSMAEFDHENPIELTGEVIEWQFINPHSWLIMYVSDENGELIEWALESTSPSVLRNRGYSRNTFKEGDVVTIKVSPRRDGSPEGGLGSILLINDQRFLGKAN